MDCVPEEHLAPLLCPLLVAIHPLIANEQMDQCMHLLFTKRRTELTHCELWTHLCYVLHDGTDIGARIHSFMRPPNVC